MPRAYLAGGTIRTARFVKIDTTANQSVLEADANERVFGVSQFGSYTTPLPTYTTDPPEAAVEGGSLDVHQVGEECRLMIGTGGCTAGDLLKSDADGKGVLAAETAGLKEEVGARALETAAAGDYALVQVLTQTVTTET